jgi:hypothetical protein
MAALGDQVVPSGLICDLHARVAYLRGVLRLSRSASYVGKL